MVDPAMTPQSTSFSVTIPHFVGTNWYDVKAKMLALLATRTGNSGIPLIFLVRETRLLWENTDDITNLQERRIATKSHGGNTYDLDNRELFRILMNTFTSTTLDNVVRSFQKHNDGIAAWNAILANVEGGNYTSELKRQGDHVIEGAFFDPTKNFTFEKYFDKHVKSHELHAEANAPVPEWRKIDLFVKGIQCTALQNDFRGLKDDPKYSTFTALYNKLNENYRTLISQGILKPVSVFKRKISQVDTDTNTGRGFGRGRRGRGFGRGGRNHNQGRHYGRGTGRGGRRGQGGRGSEMAKVNIQCLPPNIDLTDLSFPDDQWYNFNQEQRNTISALRRLRNGGRGGPGRGTKNGGDNVSSFGDQTSGGNNNDRHIYQLVQLPPVPSNKAPNPPNSGQNNNNSDNTRSSNAGSAFGRPN